MNTIASSDSVAGFILAGGRSSRLGTDKALALYGGLPLIQVAQRIFAEAQMRASIAGPRRDLSAFAEAIPDVFPECGPLGGVHAALSSTEAAWNLFLPVDLPLMPSSLLQCLLVRAMLTEAPVTVARLNGRIQPFPVVLHRSTLAHVTQRLQSGETACHRAWQAIPGELHSALDAVAVESLVQCGQCSHRQGVPPAWWFQSANTPAELARLNRLAAKLKADINPQGDGSQVI